MSSTGTTLEMTPLLPWRPAILSPSVRRRRWATVTRTIFSTPAAQVAVLVAVKDLDVHDLAALAVGQAQGGVLDLARLFAKDGAQQFLFGRQFGLALGRDLADQDVARRRLRRRCG